MGHFTQDVMCQHFSGQKITQILDGFRNLSVMPFFIFAGLVEGYISPDSSYNVFERVLLGSCGGVVFGLSLLFGLPGKYEYWL